MVDTGITQRNLYSAVRVTATYQLDGGEPSAIFGTGFIAESEQPGRFGIVTNRHIVDRAWKDPLWADSSIRLEFDLWQDRTTKTTFDMFPSSFYYHNDDSIDVAAIPLDFSTVQNCTHKNIILDNHITWSYLMESLEQWEILEPSENVYFPGYPEWYDHNGGRPIMRTGAIVSDPQNDYRRYNGTPTMVDGNRQILFEAFSSSGNSGSPVFVSQRGIKAGLGILYDGVYHPSLLVGINAGHFETKGESVETIDNKLLVTNWHVGLSRMFKTSAIVDVLAQMCQSYSWPAS
ncbi:trypsin-like peptidase domain-containing protein [Mycobacteroides abscessus]|uniref:trypsin-like peptidase domain-containing protein n=1 Tax=Mycobacteroides abscessus TaxID=36809 RepID=UPI0013000799|nr:trypsin-like peptidase domain-containing protein [Mycobacteroides abscessus]